MRNQILQGDSLDVLKTLPDGIVQCCVTSPPYWGLRDYGTAEWEGGDAECEHRVGNQVCDSKWDGAIQSGVRPGADASVCTKCGARRIDQQLGLEPTPELYVERMVAVFREVRRVLRDDGTLWLNLGDSYAGSGAGGGGNRKGNEHGQHDVMVGQRPSIGTGLKPKDLVGIPWRVAFALQADGWWLRSDIIWHKPNQMPESVRDRPTKAHEYLFLLAKSKRYYYDADAVREKSAGPGKRCGPKNDASRNDGDRCQIVRGDGVTRNRRSVWTVTTKPFRGAHFAVFPPDLIEPCIKAGSGTDEPHRLVLDPFMGSGTTALVAYELGRDYLGIELNAEYIEMANGRLGELPLRLLGEGWQA